MFVFLIQYILCVKKKKLQHLVVYKVLRLNRFLMVVGILQLPSSE